MSLAEDLAKRDRCYSYGRYYNCHSGWYYWGRWVFAGVILVVFFIVLLICLIMARRRRRRGAQPYYGTGWMAPGPKYGDSNQNGYQNNYQMNQGGNGGGWAGAQNYQNPPPAYGQSPAQQPYTGTAYDPNQGYYAPQQGQDTGVQSPPHAYQPESNVYPPPPAVPGTK